VLRSGTDAHTVEVRQAFVPRANEATGNVSTPPAFWTLVRVSTGYACRYARVNTESMTAELLPVSQYLQFKVRVHRHGSSAL
jgi:hypothetical protein